ncbi:mRNA interferase MazF [Stackebrandtia albiflava]|uniref:mRNA interferase n=2 Tax=Stackebrandtia albiflava TaxID=406432 RepID=A0A562V4T1_9ACTN|nr:type II toxin-antitoxin system PemK/MazF family toxin [Stackebrandtia albiflava]TWJ12899.1 mRNA interferase MazF [Stackebrandtia albiflava]
MRRGDIYLVDFEPHQGSEANKVRPAVIVSNDAANRSAERRGRGVVTVVPLTSNTTRILSFQVYLEGRESGLRQDSKIQTEQIRAVDVSRIRNRLSTLSDQKLMELDRATRLHLAL